MTIGAKMWTAEHICKIKLKLVKLLWTMRDKVKEKVKARFKIKVKVIKVIKVNIHLKNVFQLRTMCFN